MPRLEADVRTRGLSVFLEGAGYLSGWAKDALDERFREMTGKTHEQLIDIQAIRSAQTGDYLGAEQLPILEKAMYNPSNFRSIQLH